jgi:hypothetical protein
MKKNKNKFSVSTDYTPWEVVDAINWILKQNFNIEIKSLSEDDDETQKYEIVKLEN